MVVSGSLAHCKRRIISWRWDSNEGLERSKNQSGHGDLNKRIFCLTWLIDLKDPSTFQVSFYALSSLILTCRQVCYEVTSCFFSSNTFVVTTHDTYSKKRIGGMRCNPPKYLFASQEYLRIDVSRILSSDYLETRLNDTDCLTGFWVSK